ncbi:hypothetical protein CARUB_v10023834mg, partial [Capsella rubella]
RPNKNKVQAQFFLFPYFFFFFFFSHILKPLVSPSPGTTIISMAKTLSRSTASRVASRFFSTSNAAASHSTLPSHLLSRRTSPTLFHAIGYIPALTRFTTIRTRMDRSGGSYSPLKSGSNFSDRPPTEMAPLFPGCDYEHWLIVMEKPGGENAQKQQMIDCYVQTLAKIVGSEEEAKKKIYNVSCERYFGFGCQIDEETSNKLEGLPGVMFVLPDSYVDPENKDYGAELFENGEVVPRPPERQRRIVELTTQRGSDKPKYHDRTRNVRRRENMR